MATPPRKDSATAAGAPGTAPVDRRTYGAPDAAAAAALEGSLEHRIQGFAVRQHGVITRAQLTAAGCGSGARQHRLRERRLLPLHRGVYLVGPIALPRSREMAAVLACGPRAVLSHRSAAVLWRLTERRNTAEPVDVTVSRVDRRRRPGIRTHRSSTLRTDDVRWLEGIPVTAPARTLLDLAASERSSHLERTVAEALALRIVTAEEVGALLRRHPRAPGGPVLRALLADDPEARRSRSTAEDRVEALLRRARLPRPERNVVVAGRERDLVWRGQGLVVEVDGFSDHTSRRSFEMDRRRDAELVAAGFRVVRLTVRQIEEEPEAVVALISRLLATPA